MRLSILFFFTVFFIHAQEFQLEGKVTDLNDRSLSYVTVLLLKSKDSVYVAGTATDDTGKFILEKVPPGKYVVKTTFIGYQPVYRPVEVASDHDLGTVKLSQAEETLDEVSIRAPRPTVRREIDRLVFNVENTSVSGGSTWDILNKTPSVILQQNSITIKNQQTTVYINDRKVNLSQAEIRSLLESYSGANIKAIEVITKPSSKYDAEGGMILNIVTSKNIVAGYKGSISGNYTQAIFPKYRLGTSHFFKNNWLNLYVDYNVNPKKERKNDLSDITFFEPGGNDIASFWETDFERITRSNAHNINTSVDFDLGAKSSLNISSNLLIEPNTSFSNSVTAEIYDAQRELDSTFNTLSSLDTDKVNVALDLTYDQKIGEKGAGLVVKAHYTNFDRSRFQDVSTNYFLPDGTLTRNNRFSTDAEQKINIYVGQADLNFSLGEASLETGVKLSVIDSESGIDFFDIENGNQSLDPTLTDHFIFDETILGGFASFSRDWEKWGLRAGLRAEHTSTEGVSVSLGQTNTRDYTDLFPSAVISHKPNDNHSFNIAYKRSVDRPRYEQLNPFRYFLNENNFTGGNPRLLPGITDRYSIGYVLKSKYAFELYYREGENNIESLSLQDNAQRTLRTAPVNLIEKIGYGLDFTYSNSFFPWWYFSNYSAIFHEENTFLGIESNNLPVTVDTEGFYTQFYNNFTFSKDRTFSGEVTFAYLSSYISGSYILDPYATLSVGLRKTLWNNRASLTVYVNDILNTTDTRLHSRYLNQDNSFFARQETRYIRVGFTYNFGNFRLRDNAKEIRNEERGRI